MDCLIYTIFTAMMDSPARRRLDSTIIGVVVAILLAVIAIAIIVTIVLFIMK